VAIVEAALPAIAGSRFGVGCHANITTASILAVLSVAHRLCTATSAAR
jgi:2-isopropylmalate synthase